MSDIRKCSVPDCPSRFYAKTFCSKHYHRFRKYGDPLMTHVFVPKECTVSDCVRRALHVNGLCGAHYHRAKAGRELEGPIRQARVARGVCVVDDCKQLDRGPHGYCGTHWARIQHNGSPHIVVPNRDRKWRRGEVNPAWSGDSISYKGAHRRVARLRGLAADQQCVDCGGSARQWSYNHLDPSEKRAPNGFRYSTDPHFYVPRCVSCHRYFDLAESKREAQRKEVSDGRTELGSPRREPA
jgi:hypothetical protein